MSVMNRVFLALKAMLVPIFIIQSQKHQNMTEVRKHSKRPRGITETMRKTISKAQKEHYENDIIHNLLAELNGKPKNNHIRKESPRKHSSPLKTNSSPSSSTGKVSVNGNNETQPFPKIVQMVSTMSSILQETPQKGKGYKLTCSSRPSTNYSTESEEEALKEQNQRFKALCVAEENKLASLEKQINEENKVQRLRLHLYRQKIQKLKKIVALEIFPSEESEQDEEDIEICDTLSIDSK